MAPNETTTVFYIYYETASRACQHAAYTELGQALAIASISGWTHAAASLYRKSVLLAVINGGARQTLHT